MTSDLARRIWEHRSGAKDGFTKRHGLSRRVWYETFSDIRDAIPHERNMKHWRRSWKVCLILDLNPDWRDLYDDLNA